MTVKTLAARHPAFDLLGYRAKEKKIGQKKSRKKSIPLAAPEKKSELH